VSKGLLRKAEKAEPKELIGVGNYYGKDYGELLVLSLTSHTLKCSFEAYKSIGSEP
jgi:hypothetical protein